MKKILITALTVLGWNMAMAQDFLAPHSYIIQKVTQGYFTTKAGATLPNDNKCITKAEAISYLNIDQSFLPKDDRMPWFSELVPCTNTATFYEMATQNVYACCGTYIFGAGFNPNLEQACNSNKINGNAFWNVNASEQSLCGVAPCHTATLQSAMMRTAVKKDTIMPVAARSMMMAAASAYGGPFNRAGIWAQVPDGKWVSFSVRQNFTRSGIYYLGIAADNIFKVAVDGVQVAYYSSINQGAFEIWYIIPINFTAGMHTVTISAMNDAGPAGVAAELYNNTETEIRNATSYSMLNLMFSTKDMRGSASTYMCY
ncbi:hypothetical protein [Chitinophaga vietnamensis]|uniref:hypothetical protein n=1 Tax=Chitinophaga vietnamensis TaxID=2593957 RepID=UPI001178CE2B|nr:hypothetical protein [Chitinophaga vietnamensis]